MPKRTVERVVLAGGLCGLLVACGGEKRSGSSESAAASSSAATPATAATPVPGGRVIEIEMYSNEKGNYFEPNQITAKQGDVLKFELKLGVHNVNFLVDSNPGKKGLPAPSALLQLPDQTLEIAVTFEPGTYYFQCDPHAALGMKGLLTVTK